jgi:hypothetical protein
MALYFGFFDSVDEDRTYSAADISSYFTSILTDGVIKESDSSLQVQAATGLSVNVASGRAINSGKWAYNSDNANVALDAADLTNPRIDRVVLRMNSNTAFRSIYLAVIKGTAAAEPTAPAVVRTGGIYDLSLAQVYVEANATAINSADISDEREDTTVCGYAQSKLGVGGITISKLTPAEYAAITTKDSNTLYIVTDGSKGALYIGSVKLSGGGVSGVGAPLGLLDGITTSVIGTAEEEA